MFASPKTTSILGNVLPERGGVDSSMIAVAFIVGFTLSLNIVELTMAHRNPHELATKLITSETGASNATLGKVEQLAAAIASCSRLQPLSRSSPQSTQFRARRTQTTG